MENKDFRDDLILSLSLYQSPGQAFSAASAEPSQEPSLGAGHMNAHQNYTPTLYGLTLEYCFKPLAQHLTVIS